MKACLLDCKKLSMTTTNIQEWPWWWWLLFIFELWAYYWWWGMSLFRVVQCNVTWYPILAEWSLWARTYKWLRSKACNNRKLSNIILVKQKQMSNTTFSAVLYPSRSFPSSLSLSLSLSLFLSLSFFLYFSLSFSISVSLSLSLSLTLPPPFYISLYCLFTLPFSCSLLLARSLALSVFLSCYFFTVIDWLFV